MVEMWNLIACVSVMYSLAKLSVVIIWRWTMLIKIFFVSLALICTKTISKWMHLTAFYCKLISFTVYLFKWQIWHPFYVSSFDNALIQFTNWGGFSLCSKSEIVSMIKVVRFPPPLNVSNIIFVLHLSHLLPWIWEIDYLINCLSIMDLPCFPALL